MWWRREKARTPFIGSSFDAALQWCQANNEQIQIKGPDAFDIFLGPHVIHVERFMDDDWLHAWAVLPDAPLNMTNGKSMLQSYGKFAERQFERPDVIMDFGTDGRIIARFLKLMKFQGSSDLMIFNMLITMEYLISKSESNVYPVESAYFYLNGRKYHEASDAAISYFKGRGLRKIEDNGHYMSFDTGGLYCVVPKGGISHEFSFRYGFSDFNKDGMTDEVRLSAQFISGAYRKMNIKTMSYMFSDGVSEMAISGVLTEGTEAMPIFDRTLAELTQVVLDSMELIKMNPGLVKGTQIITSEAEALELVSKYHGNKTGGIENLIE